MPEPSLGEILSIGREGVIPTAAPIDNRQLISEFNENARLKAQMSWNKYKVFQDQLAQKFQSLEDIDKLEVAPQDREQLDKDRKAMLDSIWKSPTEFFGSGNLKKRTEIEGMISKYRKDATKSKMSYGLEREYNNFMLQSPGFDTPENKKELTDYRNTPLDDRNKIPNFTMLPVFDSSVLLKNILGPQGISTRVSPYSENKDGYMFQGQQTTDNYVLAMNAWMGALHSTDPNGQSHYRFAENEYNKLKPEQKQMYEKDAPGGLSEPEKKDFGINKFWADYGEQQMGFRANAMGEWDKLNPTEKLKYKGADGTPSFEVYFSKHPDIIKKDVQAAIKADPYQLLKERYNLMGWLEGIKQGGRKELEEVRVNLRGLSPDDQSKAIQTLSDGLIDDAIKSGDSLNIGGKKYYKMKAADPVLNIYKTEEKKDFKTTTSVPQDIVVSDDGVTGYTVYYKDKEKKEIDPDKTRPLLMNNFTTDFGKYLIGQAGVRKMKDINKPSGKHPLPKGQPKTVSQGGHTYTWDEVTGTYK